MPDRVLTAKDEKDRPILIVNAGGGVILCRYKDMSPETRDYLRRVVVAISSKGGGISDHDGKPIAPGDVDGFLDFKDEDDVCG